MPSRPARLALLGPVTLVVMLACGGDGGGDYGGPPVQDTLYSLRVNVTGPGWVGASGNRINCGRDCTESYRQGAVVVLHGHHWLGLYPVNWAGCNARTDSTCTVNMTADRSITAAF